MVKVWRHSGRVALAAVAALTFGACFEKGGADENDDPPTTTTTAAKRPSTTTTTPTPSTEAPATTAPSPTTPGKVSSTAEPGVIKGRVLDEQGDPVANATITAAGYTARSNSVKTATTGADGHYRLPITSGLYTVNGEAAVGFEGKTYRLYLHPTDGDCGQKESANGIVKDFTLKLTGLETCQTSPDPNNYGSYTGATIDLSPQLSGLPGDAKLTLSLSPVGALADGSPGKTLTVTKTVAALSNFSGALPTTRYAHDIPLGRYRITGYATQASGARQELQFGSLGTIDADASSPVAAYTFSFDPIDSLTSRGVEVTTVVVYAGAGAAPTPTPTPTSPPPTSPPPTSPPPSPTTTAADPDCPPDPSTGIPKCSSHW